MLRPVMSLSILALALHSCASVRQDPQIPSPNDLFVATNHAFVGRPFNANDQLDAD